MRKRGIPGVHHITRRVMGLGLSGSFAAWARHATMVVDTLAKTVDEVTVLVVCQRHNPGALWLPYRLWLLLRMWLP